MGNSNINLYYDRNETKRKRFETIKFISKALLLSVVITGASYGYSMNLETKINSIKNENMKIEQQINENTGVNKLLLDLKELDRKYTDRKKLIEEASKLGCNYIGLFAEINDVIAEGVYVNNIATNSSGELQLDGYGINNLAIASTVENLSESKLIEDVDSVTINSSSDSLDLKYSIKAKLKVNQSENK